MAPVLSLAKVSAGYGRGDIVRDVDLAVPEGRIVTVLGPNGSGKSTLIKVVAGLLAARQGRIALGDSDLTALDAPARARAGIAYVPQENNIFRNLSVGENLRMAVEFLNGAGTADASAARERVFALFPELAGRLDDIAGNLSGGQRQMLAFASALMSEPSLLLLDEPSSGLSPRYVGDMLRTVRAVNEAGIPILMVEQNVKAALEVADEAVVLVGGEVRLAAPAQAVAAGHDIHRLFLGGAR